MRELGEGARLNVSSHMMRACTDQVRSMGLLDELGQVTHVFSDKTGTMTANHMQFRQCFVAGVPFGSGQVRASVCLRSVQSRAISCYLVRSRAISTGRDA